MKKKFICICAILSILLFTIIGIILWQSNDPDTNSTEVNLLFNDFISITMAKDDGDSLIASLDNATLHDGDFDVYSAPVIAKLQFVKKHCYTEGLYFKDLFSYENKFYDMPENFYKIICNYFSGQNLLKNALPNVKTVKVKAEATNGRYMTLTNDHINDIKNILSSAKTSNMYSSGKLPYQKFPQYTIKLYGQGNDSLDLYLIDEHTIYVKDSLSGNIVNIDSDELWKFIGSLIK